MDAARGQRPNPLMVTTESDSARYIMIGATPPKLVFSGMTTLIAIPDATPASTAFPPFSRMRYPAAAAR